MAGGVFRVDKCYYLARQDVLVLAGGLVSGDVQTGWAIDLPREIKGPGWVPIHDVSSVDFRDGLTKLCVVLLYQVVEGHPFMEFSHLEGLPLQVKDLTI